MSFHDNICPRGYFCPAGTSYRLQYPCPSGYFNDQFGAQSQDACTLCPQGHFCPEGSPSIGPVCPTGHVCGLGSGLPTKCIAGTWSDVEGLVTTEQCKNCTPGSYCMEGSSYPTPCPPGTYSYVQGAMSGAQCYACDAGRACPTFGLTYSPEPCALGHYCPSGTVYTTQYPCPSGTWNPNRTDLVQPSGCQTCPERKACWSGTGHSSQPIRDCYPGHYCPPGTPHEEAFDCPAGTFSSSVALADVSECWTCDPGSWCGGGQIAPSGACARGYYCPAGTRFSTQFPCPPGTYSNETNNSVVDQCEPCPLGHFCTVHTHTPDPCVAGTFSRHYSTESSGITSLGGNAVELGVKSEFPYCETCTAGYSCPDDGMIEPIPCGTGKFSTSGERDCAICPAGYFCDSNTTTFTSLNQSQRCPAGLYCPEGTAVTPHLDTHACISGHYCPEATPVYKECTPGTYMNRTAAEVVTDCVVCPAGYWCPSATITWIYTECKEGHFCPEGSEFETQVQCMGGTYRETKGARSQDDCGTCVAGTYCPSGSASGIICPVGSYCDIGVAIPVDCPHGTYNPRLGIERSEECQSCDAGWYCDQPGLSAKTGLCTEGFFCPNGSSTATAVTCFAGSYCPEGTAHPYPCRPGTFNMNEGSQAVSACVDCTAGYYCDGERNIVEDGECDAGFYCSQGSSTPRPTDGVTGDVCPAGSKCINGSTAPQPCPPGLHTPVVGMSECAGCPEGFFCPDFMTVVPVVCPSGNYCPANSSNPMPCPPGSYSNISQLSSINECKLCPPGLYCSAYGMTEPAQECLAGYWCESGATLGSSSLNISASFGEQKSGPCPAGFYCLAGTPLPVPCPPGTFCPGGNALPSACEPGTYNMYDTQTACSPCPAGYWCSPGGVVDFAMGTFYATAGIHACADPAGGVRAWSELIGTNSTDIAGGIAKVKAGHIFLSGSSLGSFDDAPSYGAGKYGAFVTKRNVDGSLLWTTFVDVATGEDQFGHGVSVDSQEGVYLGVRASSSAYLVKLSSCGNVLWSRALGDGAPASGSTVSVSTGHDFVLVASKLDSGISKIYRYDADGNLAWDQNLNLNALDEPTSVTVNVDGGGYVVGQATATLHGQTFVGGNSDVFLIKFNSSGVLEWTRMVGSSQADSPTSVVSDNSSNAYVTGSVSGQGSTLVSFLTSTTLGGFDSFLLKYDPSGDMLWHQMIASASDDKAGAIDLDDSGNVYIAGYTNGSLDNECFSGQEDMFLTKYSPSGTRQWTRSIVTQTLDTGIAVSATGDGVHVVGSTHALLVGNTPTAGSSDLFLAKYFSTASCVGLSEGMDFICPAGHFCPEALNSLAAGRCPLGTFSNLTGLHNVSQCTTCPPGMWCGDIGLERVSGLCAEGYFCTKSSASPTGSSCDSRAIICDTPSCESMISRSSIPECGGECLQGTYCPRGSSYAIDAPPGSYVDSDHSPEISGPCKAGFYCSQPRGTQEQPDGSIPGFAHCPSGHYCPTGSVLPIRCQPGSYNPSSHMTNESDCLVCPAGFACPFYNMSSYVEYPCQAGYYCPSGSVDTTWGDHICPIGHSCPAQSGHPIPCAATFYQDEPQQSSCKTCLDGYYCPGTSIAGVVGGISICPEGHICPAPAQQASACPAGQFAYLQGQSVCQICPARFTCQQPGTSVPMTCPPGNYCPEENSSPIPCPQGRHIISHPCPTAVSPFCLTTCWATTPAMAAYLSTS